MFVAKYFEILDIKKDLPTVEEARQLLNDYIPKAKARSVKVCKIIHGYGSTGVGGALRVALRKSLANNKKQNKIVDYVTGEDWEPFGEPSRKLIEVCPELSKDEDLNHYNEGITLVLLSLK